VRISSESVSALGQPRLTKPTLGMELGDLIGEEITALIPLLSQFSGFYLGFAWVLLRF
jgi:hypothetical protein